jgi:ribosomal protein L32
MFSIPTFPKLIILVAVAVLVYMWSKRNMAQSRGGQGSANRQAGGRRGNTRSAAKGPNTTPPKMQAKTVEDLVKCSSCGTYIAAGSRCDCGQGGR